MIEFVSDMLASPLIQRAFIVAVLVGAGRPGGGHLPGSAGPGAAGRRDRAHRPDRHRPGLAGRGRRQRHSSRRLGRPRGDPHQRAGSRDDRGHPRQRPDPGRRGPGNPVLRGIAGGVILIRVAGGTTTNLNSYLFGSISTVSVSDAWFTIALATLVLLVGLGLRGRCSPCAMTRSSPVPAGCPQALSTSWWPWLRR